MNDERDFYWAGHAAAGLAEEYLICVYGTRTDESSIGVKVVKAVFVVIVSAFFALILLVIWGTNRFLTRFVFQKIEEPLEILAHGAEEIGTGNLDFRIQYGQNGQQDEFASVCAAFDDMARRLKNSVERTRREEESRKELLASISHDLRSPLTSIRTYMEGLLDGVTQSAEAQTRYLRTIKKKTEEIERMVSQLFLFSKLDLEEYPMNLKPVCLDEWLKNLFLETGDEYREKVLR